MEEIVNLEKSLSALDRIYDLYQKYTTTLKLVCKKGCASCCTRNVTMTTLEGYQIVCFLESQKRDDVLPKVAAASTQDRFLPQITTNALADLYMSHKEAPEEAFTAMEEKCIFLEGNVCTIYPVRPFACRCLISERNCTETGYASVGSFTVTISTLLLQYIEQADANGGFSNLVDILMVLMQTEGRRAYEQSRLELSRLLKNRPIPLLLVPPEHQQQVSPILTELQRIVS